MNKISDVVAAVAIAAVLAVGMLEWLAGCGEHWIDAAGVTHPYECVILTFLN